jgi:hypothetical protein
LGGPGLVCCVLLAADASLGIFGVDDYRRGGCVCGVPRDTHRQGASQPRHGPPICCLYGWQSDRAPALPPPLLRDPAAMGVFNIAAGLHLLGSGPVAKLF